jgi:hypothetical protein
MECDWEKLFKKMSTEEKTQSYQISLPRTRKIASVNQNPTKKWNGFESLIETLEDGVLKGEGDGIEEGIDVEIGTVGGRVQFP